MFTYVEVSKNVYPYRTLHIDGCPVLNRVRHSRHLSLQDVGRYDGVRVDFCSRCMPVKRDAANGRTTYSDGQRQFWAIQREFKDEEARIWRRIHAARKVVALRLALEEAEAALDKGKEQAEVLASVEAEARRGEYSPLEVTVSRR